MGTIDIADAQVSKDSGLKSGVGRRTFIVAIILMSGCFFVWQCVWAVLNPSFRGPDEVQHLNSSLRVATTGAWPDPRNAVIDTGVILATHEAGFMAGGNDHFAQANITPLRGGLGENAGYAQPYALSSITPHIDRTVIEYGAGGHPDHGDQMTQHPPLYYQIVGGALRVTGAIDWQWDRQLLFIRIVSALMTLPLIPSIVYTARRIGASRPVSLATGTLVFFVPQLVFATSVASNDALGIGAGALTIAGCAAAMFGKGTWRPVIFTGIMLGIGMWSKGTFVPMGLVVGLAFLLNPSVARWRRRWAQGITAGMVGVLVGGFWWVRNMVQFGSLQPSGLNRASAGEGTDVSRYANQSFRLMVDSSWGQFGWLEWWLPWWLIAALAITALVSLIFSLARGPDRLRRTNLVLFYFVVGLFLLIKAWGTFQNSGYVAGIQGRYMFPAIVGLIVVCAAAWYPLMEGSVERGRRFMLFAPGVLSAIVAVLSFVLWTWACYYAPESRISIDWTRWSLASGFAITTLQILAVLGVLSVLIAALIPGLAFRKRIVLAEDADSQLELDRRKTGEFGTEDVEPELESTGECK
ncbi:MAG: DUF2142 domain-containing protein [Ancrocorticia sp.]|uniref:DUF2142 domain-containing protein n=1 Tax=Ancrocorticia sp. TaxID=2593684 RepID=UPI003F92089B